MCGDSTQLLASPTHVYLVLRQVKNDLLVSSPSKTLWLSDVKVISKPYPSNYFAFACHAVPACPFSHRQTTSCLR